jgi:tRNA pseudouridine38-40 synthase
LQIVRFALGVSYDGSGFEGWQSQPSGRAVQDVLEAAIAAIAGHSIRVTTAGRTDAGVHATGQVVHFDTEVERPLTAWVRGVNAHLPAAVAVRWAHPVESEFHARFSARGRTYRYVLYNAPVRPALFAGQVGWHHVALNARAMSDAAQHLVGRHDFSSFRAADCQAASPVRELRRLAITTRGPYLVFDLEADAFLYHMVRNIVGALVYVGDGRLGPAAIERLLTTRDRRRAPPTFAANGLYLTRVAYEPRWGLPIDDTMPHGDALELPIVAYE